MTMDVLVVRHGRATPREEAAERGVPDDERPLTADGRKRMKRVARGLARQVPGIETLFSSPLRRARETAEIVEAAYPDLEHAETSALLPDAPPERLASFLWEAGAGERVAIVGHEPQLSTFVSHALAGAPHPFIELRKGGACLLRFDGDVAAGSARLLWLLTPKALRRL